MSDFEGTHPRQNPQIPGAFSKRQHTPPEVELEEHAARDRENLHTELQHLKTTSDELIARGEESFMDDPAELNYLAGCMMIVRLADLIASRLPEEAKDARPNIPWRQIAGMRNLLSHDYRSSSKGVVWATLANDVPALLDDLLADPTL